MSPMFPTSLPGLAAPEAAGRAKQFELRFLWPNAEVRCRVLLARSVRQQDRSLKHAKERFLFSPATLCRGLDGGLRAELS
ncbi:hypothetical protein SRHO_G00294690 [Serrasalmus rhombeus]